MKKTSIHIETIATDKRTMGIVGKDDIVNKNGM